MGSRSASRTAGLAASGPLSVAVQRYGVHTVQRYARYSTGSVYDVKGKGPVTARFQSQ